VWLNDNSSSSCKTTSGAMSLTCVPTRSSSRRWLSRISGRTSSNSVKSSRTAKTSRPELDVRSCATKLAVRPLKDVRANRTNRQRQSSPSCTELLPNLPLNLRLTTLVGDPSYGRAMSAISTSSVRRLKWKRRRVGVEAVVIQVTTLHVARCRNWFSIPSAPRCSAGVSHSRLFAGRAQQELRPPGTSLAVHALLRHGPLDDALDDSALASSVRGTTQRTVAALQIPSAPFRQ